MAKVDGRTLDHKTLEHLRKLAVKRVIEDGEKPGEPGKVFLVVDDHPAHKANRVKEFIKKMKGRLINREILYAEHESRSA